MSLYIYLTDTWWIEANVKLWNYPQEAGTPSSLKSLYPTVPAFERHLQMLLKGPHNLTEAPYKIAIKKFLLCFFLFHLRLAN